MTAIRLGVDVRPTQDYLNQLSRAVATRVRRCTAVKRVALEKIREDNQEARAYGFKHLDRILELQIRSYPKYTINIERFLNELKLARVKIASLTSLDVGCMN